MIRQYFFGIIALTFAAGAETLPGHYLVELPTRPVAAIAASRGVRLSDSALAAQRTTVRVEQQRMRARIAGAGTEILDSFETVHNALVVRMTDQRAAQIRGMAGVKSVRPVRIYHQVLDRALPLQKVLDAWQQAGGIDKAGAGVKIALIDTGIDVHHAAFQGAGLAVPAGFPLVNRTTDQAYTNSKIIVARAYTSPSTGRPYTPADVIGHGTGVAMVAAGGTNNGTYGPITGVAPQAWLGNYKVFPDDTSGAPDSLIIRALEDAVADGMDIINLSLGAFPATRPTDDSLAIAVENAAAAGVLITIAAGNDGDVPNTVASPGIAPSAITAGSSLNDRIFSGKVTVEGSSPIAALPCDGPNPASAITGPVADVSALDQTGLACAAFPAGSLKGTIALILRGTCTFELKLANAQKAGAAAAIVYTYAESPDAATMSTGRARLPSVMVSNGDGTALKQKAAAGPLEAVVDFTLSAFTVSSARLSAFSSRGPSSDGGIKPDLLGIGENIYTAAPAGHGSYTVESGTSFSSPMLAGAAALLKGVRPGLTSRQYRSLLVNSASVFSVDGTNPVDVQSGGTGLLNMSATVSNAIAAWPVSLSFGIGGSTINRTKTLTITNLGATADTFSVSAQALGIGPIPAVSTNTVQLAPGESRDIGVQFAADQLTGGIYQGFVQLQGVQSTVVDRVPYWYGVPTQIAKYIQILSAPSAVPRDGVFDVELRVLDVNGVPVTSGITASIVSGAAVTSVESSDADIPGSFLIHVLAPAVGGTLTVQVQIGDVATPVSVRVM